MLTSADIGVAMGQSGTNVAREAATMVLSDDNFATIVVPTKAGRPVYDNVRKYIIYIFATPPPRRSRCSCSRSAAAACRCR